MKRSTIVFNLFGAVALLVPMMSGAEEFTGTLKKIQSTASVTIGHRDASFPLSFFDAQHKPVGYSLDICSHIVEQIKKELALSALKVNYVAVSSSDRIARVVDGQVDLECGSTTITKERLKQVNFANTIFYADTKILVKANSGIRTVDDLKGKRITINQGATGAPVLAKLDQQKGLKIEYVKSHDNIESFKLLEDNKVSAFVQDDVQLAMLAARSADPKEYELLNESLSRDPISIMIRKDDPQLEKLVNATLANLTASGELNKIYAKWFVTPQFKFPMGDALKKILKNPNNSPAE